MSAIGYYKSYQSYKDDYSKWRSERDLQYAKEQNYILKNPNLIETEDIQKSKALLRAVNLMEEYSYKKSGNLEAVSNSVIELGLQYSAIGGAALGYLLTKTKSIKSVIKMLSKDNARRASLLTTSFTTLSGAVATILAFPVYNWVSKAEVKARQKTRQEVMKDELNNPKIFAALTQEQENQLEQNLLNSKKVKKFTINPVSTFRDKVKQVKDFSEDTWEYLRQKKDFENQLFAEERFYNQELTTDEIKEAKEDQQILIKLVDKINQASQEYQEKSQIVTASLITSSFALGSLFSLAYERIMKHLKLKSKALPANVGLYLMLGTSILGMSVQKKAAQIGKFKVLQNLMQNPEQLVYVSDEKTGKIKDVEIKTEKLTLKDFIKNIWKDAKAYENWKKETFNEEKNISKSFNNIELTEKQMKDAKRLQKNMFKTFTKIDDNTQKHAESIAVLGQAVQYPLTIALNSFAGILGVKYLDKIANSKNHKDLISSSVKYISIILLSILPTILINNKIAQEEKEASQISDMLTLKDMEDYKQFADYSRFKGQI